MSDVIQVVTTTSNRADAERLARALVEQRLAACVQIDGPITSIYHWQGAIETAEEWRLTVKSLGALYDRLEAAIRAIHSYDTPEIVATPVIAVSEAYRRWLESQVAGS